MNRIVAALSQFLDPTDREYVCGDIEELRLGALAASASTLGLVIRRQLAEWSRWGPWTALLSVTCLAGSFLSGSLARVETEIFLQIRTYLQYGVAYEPGGVSVAQQITYAATATFAMLLWAWACGFMLASLSGRALWITSFLFYCVVRDGEAIRQVMAGHIILKQGFGVTMLFRLLPLDPVVIAFLLTLALGAGRAMKGVLQRSTCLCLMVVGLALITLLVWMESWFAAAFAHWSGQPYLPRTFVNRALPFLVGAWPLFSIPLVQNERKESGRRAA